MASGLMNAVKFVVSVAVGAFMAYGWYLLRGEEDLVFLAGIGAVSTIMIYILLYSMGKSSS